jgi:hypothetical protein
VPARPGKCGLERCFRSEEDKVTESCAESCNKVTKYKVIKLLSEVNLKIPKESVSVSKRTGSISTADNNRLMLFEGTIGFYSHNHYKQPGSAGRITSF